MLYKLNLFNNLRKHLSKHVQSSYLQFPISKLKGQLILICLLGVFNSLKKQTKTIQLDVP